jgi:hypothetical protein
MASLPKVRSGKSPSVDAKATFSRSDILKEMESASSYYKKAYSNNLTTYLKTLVIASKKLNEISENLYSLPAQVGAELEKTLA